MIQSSLPNIRNRSKENEASNVFNKLLQCKYMVLIVHTETQQDSFWSHD